MKQTYCYNILGDMSIWSNIAFARIWRLGNKYYGVSRSGVYELTGNTDNGTAFTSTIATVPNNLNPSLSLMRIPAMRLNASTSGNVAVSYDGEAVSMQPTLFTKAERVKLPRGIKGRFPVITVTSTQAGFQLNSIELFPEVTQKGVK